MQTVNILFLGAGNRVSLCEWFLSSAKLYNINLNLYSVEIKDPVPISKYAIILKGEKWNSPTFEQSIIDIITKYDINILIPLMDAGCTALAKIKDSIEYKTRAMVLVSSYNVCLTMEDKTLSELWFKERKVTIPYSDEYPRILKNKLGYGSRDQFIVNSNKELEIIKSYKDLSNYLSQPMIYGVEYTVDAYVSHKSVIGAVSRIRLETINGEVSRSVTKREPELLAEVERLLLSDNFVGPQTLQAIKSNKDGKFYFIEINPRFGGGVIASLKAGADFTQCVLAEFLKLPLPDCSVWTEGLLMMRANQEIWSYEHSN